MQNPFMSAAFKPDLAFTGAAERFFELLKSFSFPGSGAAGAAPPDWSALAGSLAGQFEQWLKSSQAAGPWFTAAGTPGAGAGFGAAAASFGPLPLGAGAAPQQDAQRSWDLVARLAQLQAQLASYWGEIARDAAQRFVQRMGAAAGGAPTLDNALKLYELWVNCAEESYAAAVRKDEFCRVQAQLANASAALLVEQRRHAETLVRAFGLPSRNEVDALYAQLKELRAQLAELTEARRAGAAPGKPPAAAASRDRRPRRKRKPRA
jgi:polyhydroxyalkanoate synthase subunit PhaE